MARTGEIAVLDNDIRSRIMTIRGVQVILDRDLAMLYGVDAKRINEQVKRNRERFPEDFMFRLTREVQQAEPDIDGQVDRCVPRPLYDY